MLISIIRNWICIGVQYRQLILSILGGSNVATTDHIPHVAPFVGCSVQIVLCNTSHPPKSPAKPLHHIQVRSSSAMFYCACEFDHATLRNMVGSIKAERASGWNHILTAINNGRLDSSERQDPLIALVVGNSTSEDDHTNTVVALFARKSFSSTSMS